MNIQSEKNYPYCSQSHMVYSCRCAYPSPPPQSPQNYDGDLPPNNNNNKPPKSLKTYYSSLALLWAQTTFKLICADIGWLSTIQNGDFTCIIIYPYTARIIGASQLISQPVSSIFSCSPLPSETCRTPGLSIPWSCLPASLSVCLLPSFTVPCKMVLAKPDEQETYPYHCSLHLFMTVRMSLCGPIACWILAKTSSLVKWSLYLMRSILQ